jgi:hypothetical protein
MLIQANLARFQLRIHNGGQKRKMKKIINVCRKIWTPNKHHIVNFIEVVGYYNIRHLI